ncbi:MAG TPA: MarR family transcriptional regulator [Planctomycetaceae bacterium]|nr:MarR family transcriptional regulator [Planctomycetaceae bacterium]
MPTQHLEHQIILSLRRITRASDLHSRDLMQQAGLTAPQLAALQSIARLQPVAVGTLAKSIHLSQATLTGILARLESRELISRRRCGVDRRTVHIELTAKGSIALDESPSLLQDRFRSELLKLDEWEQTQMLATLQRIASMMDVNDPDDSSAVIDRAEFPERDLRSVNAESLTAESNSISRENSR